MSQYADDTSLILDGTEQSLQESIIELNKFAKISGLKINLGKSQVIWIGSKKYSEEIYQDAQNLRWGDKTFTLLGIDFHVDLHLIPKMNFDKKLVKLKEMIKTWSCRSLTPLGRITIIKSLLISQFNHLFISLPNPSEKFIKTLNQELFKFLWSSNVDKIKRDVVTNNYIEGGLKMTNVKAYIESLKLTWVRRIYTTKNKWQAVLKSIANLNRLSNSGTDYLNVCMNNCNNQFWKDVF